MEILSAFKNSTEQITPHVKKLALIGVKGLLKSAYQFVTGFMSHPSRRLFDNELEAKEWLVED
ncbi:MAG TPA: hypothetical protein VHY08_25045 [Bacillota bacterium]|nr:hypothetical protein [Bacillota bacterium]